MEEEQSRDARITSDAIPLHPISRMRQPPSAGKSGHPSEGTRASDPRLYVDHQTCPNHPPFFPVRASRDDSGQARGAAAHLGARVSAAMPTMPGQPLKVNAS